jgi:indoleamine 2,3-dioxygenase
MRKYMPGPHRRFLESLTAISNVRTYIQASAGKSTEKEAYNAAVNELKAFRDTHIQMVTRYIVMAAKQPKPLQQDTGKVNLATASQAAENKHHLAGTGGTDLIPFLKRTRDTVQEAKC